MLFRSVVGATTAPCVDDDAAEKHDATKKHDANDKNDDAKGDENHGASGKKHTESADDSGKDN